MTEIGSIKLPISEAANLSLKVTVTGLRWWKWRIWLGARVMTLGAWITGAECEIELKP